MGIYLRTQGYVYHWDTDLEVECCITGRAHLQLYPTSVQNDRLRSQHNQEVRLFLWGTQRWLAGIPLPEILSAQLGHFGVSSTQSCSCPRTHPPGTTRI